MPERHPETQPSEVQYPKLAPFEYKSEKLHSIFVGICWPTSEQSGNLDASRSEQTNSLFSDAANFIVTALPGFSSFSFLPPSKWLKFASLTSSSFPKVHKSFW